MFETVRVAACSFVPTKYDPHGNAVRLAALFREMAASSPKPRLLLAPEGIIEGYCVGDATREHQRAPLGSDAPPTAERMRQVALTDASSVLRDFRALARELGVCLAFGYAEAVGAEVYNAAVFMDDTGKICGKCPSACHRKQQVLVIRNRRHDAFRLCSVLSSVPYSRSALGRAAVCRAWSAFSSRSKTASILGSHARNHSEPVEGIRKRAYFSLCRDSDAP